MPFTFGLAVPVKSLLAAGLKITLPASVIWMTNGSVKLMPQYAELKRIPIHH